MAHRLSHESVNHSSGELASLQSGPLLDDGGEYSAVGAT